MSPSIGFFSITVCNTTSILHTCIYILSFSVIIQKKICGSSPLQRSTAKQIYLLMNHLPDYPGINYIFLQCPLQQAARSWAVNHCLTFTVPFFHVSLQILHFPIVLPWSIVAFRSRLQPYWEAVHWKWIVGFKFLLWFRACQSTVEQHHAAYYPPWAWSATAARVIANTTAAYASSKSKLSVVFRRQCLQRERELACCFIKTDSSTECVSYALKTVHTKHPHLTK